MPKTIRNVYDEKLIYENLMKAHLLSRRGKGYREEIILFNLKQEEYIFWLDNQLNFLETYFVPRLINTTYACLKDRGMHKACINVQKGMNHCKRIWGEYYIIKMDVLRIRLKLELNRLSWNAFTKDRKTMFEKKLKELGIKYKNIEPYTPKQNGKVERSFQ